MERADSLRPPCALLAAKSWKRSSVEFPCKFPSVEKHFVLLPQGAASPLAQGGRKERSFQNDTSFVLRPAAVPCHRDYELIADEERCIPAPQSVFGLA